MKCSHCGQPISERSCPACGLEILPESLFCHRCGVKLEGSAAESSPVKDEDIDFSKRVLCSDGTCIGVVDEKGICKVCGKPYTGKTE